MREPNQKPASILRVAFILILLSFIGIGAILLAADLRCRVDIEAYAPLYPNAEAVNVSYDMFRPRALGRTIFEMESPDDIETVKQFYRDNILAVLDAERSRGLASTDWRVQPLEEGTGSRIILISACGA